MKIQAKLFLSSVVLITILIFSGCNKASNIKSDDAVSSFSFKNKSIEQLKDDEIIKYSVNNSKSDLLVFYKQVQINLKENFSNNIINVKIWVENADGVVLSNVSNLDISKEIFLKYRSVSVTCSRDNLLKTANGSSNLLPGNTIVIGSGAP